jgi:orotidine-5'-phosphate decarboxylase
MNALSKLINKNKENKIICVGLDTDIDKIPSHLLNTTNPVLEFNRAIIDATKDSVAAYKINFAFYECNGAEGFNNLKSTIDLIPKDILIIADAKRGDIGNTSDMYAKSVFNYFNCDSVTVNPYLGEDSVKPFLNYQNKLIFVLALTSNPGSADFEKLKLENGKFLFQSVIEAVNKWNTNSNCGLVFGATQFDELNKNINSFKNLPVLLPGVGAQGGSLEDVVITFKAHNRSNFLINVSRSVIYKSHGIDFAFAAKEEVEKMNNIIYKILNQ